MAGILESLLLVSSLLILLLCWWFFNLLKFLGIFYFTRSLASVKRLSWDFYLDFISDPTDGLSHSAEAASTQPRADVLYLGLYLDLRSPTVLLTQIEDVKLVMSSDTHFGKAPMYKAIEAFLGPGLLTAPINTWKLHRKLMKKSFNPSSESLDLLANFVCESTPEPNVIAGLNRDPITPFSIWSVRCLASLVLGIDLNAAELVQSWRNLQAACPPPLFTLATNYPQLLPILAPFLPSVREFLAARAKLRELIRTAPVAEDQPGTLWAALNSQLSGNIAFVFASPLSPWLVDCC